MINKTEGYTHAQAEMLKYVFNHGKVSRAELAQALGVSNLTVINGVKKLLEDGVLTECGTLPSQRGRKVTLLSVNPELYCFLSVDIGAHSTKLAVVCFDGSIIYREQLLHKRRDVRITYLTVPQLQDHIRRLSAQYRVSALCFSISGTVDYAAKTSLFCANIQGWDNVDFQKEFGDVFGLPVYLDSSGHCYALAECQFGQGRGISDLLFVSVGHSICTGIILEGKLLRGASGAAGELGHSQVHGVAPFQNWRCTCGQRSCLELYATIPMIRRKVNLQLQQQDPHRIEPDHNCDDWLIKAYEAGEATVTRVIGEAARILGQQVANAANLLNPKVIVFGGGTIHKFPGMVDTLRETIPENSLPVISRELTVVRSALGPDGALQGAALLAIYDLLKNSAEKSV